MAESEEPPPQVPSEEHDEASPPLQPDLSWFKKIKFTANTGLMVILPKWTFGRRQGG